MTSNFLRSLPLIAALVGVSSPSTAGSDDAAVQLVSGLFGALSRHAERSEFAEENVCKAIQSNEYVNRYIGIHESYYRPGMYGTTLSGFDSWNPDSSDDLAYQWLHGQVKKMSENQRGAYFDGLHRCADSLRGTKYIRVFTLTDIEHSDEVLSSIDSIYRDYLNADTERKIDADGNIVEISPQLNLDYVSYLEFDPISVRSSVNEDRLPVLPMIAALPNSDNVLKNVVAPVLDDYEAKKPELLAHYNDVQERVVSEQAASELRAASPFSHLNDSGAVDACIGYADIHYSRGIQASVYIDDDFDLLTNSTKMSESVFKVETSFTVIRGGQSGKGILGCMITGTELTAVCIDGESIRGSGCA
ncbi:hypothetical protein [Parahaliea mediterranea]|uniref:hypothetical protein n=1 Tax=Parahaliea mediterranea TaxID=651086 RepID=UPI001300B591|nr:hypothetical protein [Parahaliea mediterranea]